MLYRFEISKHSTGPLLIPTNNDDSKVFQVYYQWRITVTQCHIFFTLLLAACTLPFHMTRVNCPETSPSGIEYPSSETGEGGGEEGIWEESSVEKAFIGVFSILFISDSTDLMVEMEPPSTISCSIKKWISWVYHV